MEPINAGAEYHVTLHGPQGDTGYPTGVETGGRLVGTSDQIAELTEDFHPDGSIPFPATMLVDWFRYTPNG
jgi:hypothetical protein